jgi:outer membrane protein TolC
VDLVEMYHGTNNPAEVFAYQLNQEVFDMNGFFAGDPNDPDWLNNWMTRLELVQPVWMGGKLGAAVKQAALMAEAEQSNHQRTRQQVAFDTLTAFTNLTKAREYSDLMAKARATTAEHLRQAEAFAEVGMIVEAEVLKARVYLAEMDELQTRADAGAELAQAALNFHMGLEQSVTHELAALPRTRFAEGALDDWTAMALEQRDDLRAARNKRDAGQLEETKARAGFMPQVALIGRYDLYDDSFLGSNGSSGSLMLNARINLFRGGADRQALDAARHRTRSFDQDIDRFEEGIRLEVRQSWQDLASARARRETARASLDAAAEALRITDERFQQGLEKMIDLLDAETALREAEVRELTARYDEAFAIHRLHFAAGFSLINPVTATEDNEI